MTNRLHNEILATLKQHSGRGTKHSGNAAYLGNAHFSYGISNPVKRKIAKGFLTKHKGLPQKEFVALLNTLYRGKSHDEKSIAGMFLEYSEQHRLKIAPATLDKWLNHLEGWAEVDSLCQSNFTAEEILVSWNGWKQLLITLSKSRNINKRRASLVLLTKPARTSDDARLTKLSLRNIERLKKEKDILITKAVSWLLRDMIAKHRNEVIQYIERSRGSLPKVAVRETERKLRTGKK